MRSSRAVGCLRTARPWVGQRRWLGSSRGGRRCPIVVTRPGPDPHPGWRHVAVTVGLRASAFDNAPGCPLVVTARDQAMRSSVMMRGYGAPGRSTRSGAVVGERPTAPGRVHQPGRSSAGCLARASAPGASSTAAAHSVAGGGAGRWRVRTPGSSPRRSHDSRSSLVVRPAREYPEPCVPAALPSPQSPVWPGTLPPVLAPADANGTPVETAELAIWLPAFRSPVQKAGTDTMSILLHDLLVPPLSALTPRRRWAETAQQRHAYYGLPTDPGERIVPLCTPLVLADVAMATVVAPTPGQPAPECSICDRAWRTAEHIELRSEHEPPAQTPPAAVPTPRTNGGTQPGAARARRQTGLPHPSRTVRRVG